MAALNDGEHFLVQKYPVAVTPGLSLADPRPIQEVDLQVLAAGLAEGVQGFAPLPHVAEEIKAICRLQTGTPLLDRDFLIPRLEEELRKQHFNVLHIASHGRFGGNPDDTFLLSFNDKVTMDRLSDCVGLFRFRDTPLELLILSACETAAGDERAALGLAGVAVKAGARSALATLWHVNDPVSSRVVEEFYRLRMHKTRERTGVIVYFLLEDRSFYIYGDKGIHAAVGQETWDRIAGEVAAAAKEKNLCEGILLGLERIGTILAERFPIRPDDANELSNEVELR